MTKAKSEGLPGRSPCVLLALTLVILGAAGFPDASVAEVLDCPYGTVQRSRELGYADELWCESPDHPEHQRLHGPWRSVSRPEATPLIEGEYENGRKVGRWVSYFPDGGLSSEIWFERGERHGRSALWYANGQTRQLGQYLRGKRTGEWVAYYENGQQRLVQWFDNGAREGIYRSWYANGRLEQDGNFHADAEDALWTTYHENGELESQGHAIAGRRTGHWIFRDEGGSVRAAGEYQEGRFYSDSSMTSVAQGDTPGVEELNPARSHHVARTFIPEQ